MAQTNVFWRYKDGSSSLEDIASVLQGLVSSVSNMNTINAAGGVKCWILPTWSNRYIYKAGCIIIARSVCVRYAVGSYSDIPADAETADIVVGGNSYQVYTDTRANGVVELSLYEYASATTPLVTLVADEYKGAAEFNVASIVLNMMKEEPNEYFQNPYVPFIDEDYLYKCICIGKYSNLTTPRYMFSRATVNDNDVFEYIDTNGYPYVLSDLRVARGNLYNFVAIAIPNDGVTRHAYIQRVYCSFNAGKTYLVQISDNDTMQSVNSMLRSAQQLVWADYNSCNTWGVRWFNMSGGVDYYLFANRCIDKHSVKTSNLSKRTYRNGQPLLMPENIPYDINASRVLTLGIENAPADDFSKLNELAHSQCIQIYIPSSNTGRNWIRCSVDKYDIKRETDASALNFEIELAIPTLNTLF